MKVICYALFGKQSQRHESCFDFNSYLRGLMINIRMNRLLFPDWKIILETDQKVMDLHGEFLKKLPIIVNINKSEELTKAMLWRLKPIFEIDERQHAKYTHVLCRDLDSPPTYREAQAVQYWMNRDKAAHGITDSVSHNLPMLGGMIGFQPKYFTQLTGFSTWDQMFNGCTIDFSRKGADQTFLNKFIYPFFAKQGSDSITQHYVLGMPDSFLSDCHNKIQDMDLPIPGILRESNHVCGHIGAAGFYETSMMKFLRQYWHEFEDLAEIEKEYSQIFYWNHE